MMLHLIRQMQHYMLEAYSGATDTSVINSEVLDRLTATIQNNQGKHDFKEYVKVLCDFAKAKIECVLDQN